MSRLISQTILAALCTLLLTVSVAAQSTLTRLEGSVHDSAGQPLSGVAVTAEEESTGLKLEVASDAQGNFIFAALRPGFYTISARADGYRQKVRQHVLLRMPGSVRESIILQPGDSMAIDRENAAGASRPVPDAQVTGVFSRRDLEALPILDRNPLSLAIYESGVQIASGAAGLSTINGNRLQSNFTSFDGLSGSDLVTPRLNLSVPQVNPDSIQELRVVPAGARAEYGGGSGGHLTILSRRAENSWSGYLMDYFRDKALNANDFFSNSAKLEKLRFTQNIYGAQLSGPISTKTFFLANFEGRRTNQSVLRHAQVLTSTAKTGVFQWYKPGTDTLQSYDIVANDPRGLGIDPRIASTLAKMPDPNVTGIGDDLNTSGFQFRSPVYSQTEQAQVRLDRDFSNSHRMFIRLNWNRGRGTDVLNNGYPRYPGAVPGILKERGYAVVVALDSNLGTRAVNELRIGHLAQVSNFNRDARTKEPMFVSNTWTDPLDPSFPSSSRSPRTEVSDYLTLGRSRHTLKFGGSFRRTLQESFDATGSYPDVTFGRDFGNAPPLSIGPSGDLVISAADRQRFEYLYNDLLGRVESVSQTFYSNLSSFLPAGSTRERSFEFRDYSAFAQDDWRIKPNLLLSLGLRYDYQGVPRERNGLQAALDQASQVSATTQLDAMSYVPGKAWYKKDFNNFAPRLGLAWTPFSDARTLVLRASWGIYYDRIGGAATDFVDANTPPLSDALASYPNLAGTDIRLSDGVTPPQQPSTPELQPPATRAISSAIFDAGFASPSVQQFRFSLQKQLFRNTQFEAAYVGTRGSDLFMHLNRNQTKIEGDFLAAFLQLRAFRLNGTPVPPSNTLVRLFGSTNAAIRAISGATLDAGLVGKAANAVDQDNFAKYGPAGLSDFYLRNFPQFDTLIVATNEGRSYYDSLQVSVRKSSETFMLSAHYAWSKSLDNSSTGGAEFVQPSDSFDPGSNKGPSDFDRRHVFSAAARYAIPIGNREGSASDLPGILDGIIGGWNVGALVVWESGQRFSVSSGQEVAQAGALSLADYSGSREVGDVYRRTNGVFYFLPEQTVLFTAPPPGGRGTSGRNSFSGPGYFNLDLALYKSFRIKKLGKLGLRGEIYNLFNGAHFDLPGTNLANPVLFGRITATQGTPRVIQIALRYEF